MQKGKNWNEAHIYVLRAADYTEKHATKNENFAEACIYSAKSTLRPRNSSRLSLVLVKDRTIILIGGLSPSEATVACGF